MKKLLSCLAVIAFSFTSVSSTLAAPSSTMQTSTKTPSKTKEARIMVESDIVNMQKDAIGMIRSLIDTYAKSEKTENGNMKWTFAIKEGDTQIKIDADIEKYVSVISYLQGKQEFGAKGKIQMNMSGKRIDYDSMDADGNGTYQTIDTNLLATITFDVNVKMIGKDVFFTVSEFKTDRSGTANEVQEFDASFQEIQKYVGKTYKISGKNAGIEIENPAQALKHMEAVFQILETKSIFEVESSKGDTYRLKVKKSTLQAINLALGKKKNASMKDFALDDKKMGLTYQKTISGGILKMTDKKNKQNYMQISNENGEYTMDMVASEANRQLKTKEYMQVQMKRDYMMMKVSSIDKYSSSWFDIAWKNNQLNAKITTWGKWSDSKDTEWINTYEVRGPLDIWTGNMDLKLIENSKEYGNLMFKSEGNNHAFTFSFTTDTGMIGNIVVTGAGASQVSQNVLEIKTPEIFETIK